MLSGQRRGFRSSLLIVCSLIRKHRLTRDVQYIMEGILAVFYDRIHHHRIPKKVTGRIRVVLRHLLHVFDGHKVIHIGL